MRRIRIGVHELGPLPRRPCLFEIARQGPLGMCEIARPPAGLVSHKWDTAG